MKRPFLSKQLPAVTAAILTMSSLFAAGSARAGETVPIKGEASGSSVPRIDPFTPLTIFSGTTSHLGKVTVVGESDLSTLAIDFSSPVSPFVFPATIQQTATLIAANGDEVHISQTTTGFFSVIPGLEGFTGPYQSTGTIDGGTGRFENATGFVEGGGIATIIPGGDNDLLTFSFQGTISTVGSNKH